MKSWHFVLIALPFLLPLTAKAADIVIDDTSADDTITIRVNDFENGFSANGNLQKEAIKLLLATNKVKI